MKNEITRKQFLTLGVGAATVVLLPGCGDDGDTDTGADSGSDSGSSSTTNSTTNGTTNSTSNSTTVSTSDDTSSSGGSDPSSGEDPTDASGDSESSSGGVDESSSDGSSSGGAGACSSDPTYTMTNEHMHVVTLTLAQVEAGVEVAQDIQGSNPGHGHTLTITPADLATLQTEGSVMVTSTFDSGHEHVVTLLCG